MLYIDVPDMNDSMSSITIDDVEYYLRFTYNEKFGFWKFGLYDEDEAPIVAMTKIVPNYPLFDQYTDSRLPDGIFGCLSDTDDVGREAFNDLTAEFVYIPNEELEELNQEEEG